MVLEFDYGVNTGNRFLEFVDHDEEPEVFIAAQTKDEVKQKKTSTKDAKQPTKKPTTKTTTLTTTTAKTNKENLTTKSTNVDQRRQQSATVPAVFSDNNNQQIRGDSARGSRGGSRRGGPPFEGAGRGRSQRFNKFEGQGSSSTNEPSSLDQGGDTWSNEIGTRGGGRGRGGPRRGNFEGGRGGGIGRGRGRGGRGNFNNRSQEEGSQQENSGWQQTAESNFESTTRPQPNRDLDQEVSPAERPFEPDNTRRNPRGNFRGRTFHSNRSYGDRESVEGAQDDYRANRRQTDRQPRSFVSGVKPIEKKDGEGAHNWGNPTENPEEHPITDETTEATGATPKDWAQQVDEAEKQMTLDEYKKQLEAKKRAYQEKLPQFNTRVAGEGEDPKSWHKFEQEYRKKTDDDDEEEDEDEDGSGIEENESGEEVEEEHLSGKKKVITIPLRFKPIELSRGSAGSRGGQRRGGNRFRPNRDEQQRSTSPTQGQSSPASQQYDEQQSSYRGGRRGGDYRRPTRGTRQGGRANADPNAPALDNPEDFPTLPKQ
ncbi:unnamed protein product [Rotaria sp. Silwood2]|nr:unnamed protein product [Rotaria sp. Silwood2]CAF3195907.1 unnamed protein product [Rotaria sp. Silwood2]CAF3960280.1 unnamed protein product [Rotaria sp. Silwood2]CAF4091020.1 unnamed protein product [Rotaria sp. Silwood2]